MWYIAQITWKQIKAVKARTPSPSQHLGMSAQEPRRNLQCLWCTQPGHSIDRCYAKDPENVTRFPHSSWVNGEDPKFVKLKYNKMHTQEEARNMVNRLSKPSLAHYHQASLASTTPHIYTAVTNNNQATTSTSTDRHRQEGRYKFLVPETVTEPELAMQAQTIGDGMPHISNLW